MIATLMGVPGKLKAIYDKLVADLPATVTSRIDVSVTAIADAASYTPALATELSGLSASMTGVAAETTPCLDVPIASGYTDANFVAAGACDFVGVANDFTTGTSLYTVVNYTGAGILELAGTQTTHASGATARIVITIDGVVFCDRTSGATQYTVACPVGAMTSLFVALSKVPFKSSLLIQIASGTAGRAVTCFYKFHKTN